MNRFRSILIVVLVGLLLSYLVKLPFLEYTAMSPGAMVNYNIAKNIADGRGLIVSIKENYFNKLPVTRSPIGEIGIIYPVLLSALVEKTEKMHWPGMFFSFVGAVLFFMIVKKNLGDRTAWLSFAWLIFLPGLNLASSFLWNFSLIFMLIMISAWLLVFFRGKIPVALAGLVLGIAFWAEPWCLLCSLGFIPGMLFYRNDRKKALIDVGVFAAGFIICALPLFILTYHVQGHVLPVPYKLYFQVEDYDQYLWKSYEYPTKGVGSFIGSNLSWIKGRIVQNLWGYFRDCFFTAKTWLFLIGIPLVFFNGKKRLKEVEKTYYPCLSFSIAAFIGASMVWSRREIVQNPIFMILFVVPLLIFFIQGIEIKGFPAGLLISVLVLLLILNSYFARNHVEIKDRIKNNSMSKILASSDKSERFIASETSPSAHVAAFYPWGVNLKTERPTGLLPRNLNSERLRNLIKEFGYSYILDNSLAGENEKFRKLLNKRDYPWIKKVNNNLWDVRNLEKNTYSPNL